MSGSRDICSLSRIRWQETSSPECGHRNQTQMNQMDWPYTSQGCLKMDIIWQQETCWAKITWRLSYLSSMRNNISYITKINVEGLIDFHQLILNVGCTAELHHWQRWLLEKHLSSDRYITVIFLHSPRVLKIVILIAKLIDFKFRIVAVYKCTVF